MNSKRTADRRTRPPDAHQLFRWPTAFRRPATVVVAGSLLAGCAAGPLAPNEKLTLQAPATGRPVPVRVVALATVRGPAAAATTTVARVACPSGTIVSGGGIATTLVGGRTPPSSLHVDGEAPAGPGGDPPAASGTTASRWAATGATGGQLVLGGVTTAVAMCLRATGDLGPPSIVVASDPGPAQADTTARATASCPPQRLLLGGGGLTRVLSGSASPSLHLVGSFPSDARGSWAGDARRAPTSWSATADAGGRTGSGVQTVAFALCTAAPRARTEVVVASAPGPLSASSATTVTATCPAASLLVTGGVRTGPATGSPQRGLHLTGSFPSDAQGAAAWASSAARSADSWSARAESGGQGSPATTLTTAFAVCLRR